MAETQLRYTLEKMKLRKNHPTTNPFDSDSDGDDDSILSAEQSEGPLSTPPTARQTASPAAAFLNSVSSAAKNVMSRKNLDFSAFQRKLSSNSLFDSGSESEVRSTSTTPIKNFSSGSRDKENVVPSSFGRDGNVLVLKAEEAKSRLSSMTSMKFDFSALQRKLSSNSLFDSGSASEAKSNSTTPIKNFSNGSGDKENVATSSSERDGSVGVQKVEEATSRLKSMISKKFDFKTLQRKLSSNALFDSESESELKTASPSSIKHVSNALQDKEIVTPPYSSGVRVSSPASSCSNCSTSLERTKSDKRRDLIDLGNQSPQQLEKSLAHKAEETTVRFSNCLKIAEEISQSGACTLSVLENQGEQISRTHLEAAKMEDDLSKGEKLLGSLGGLFSKPWTPKKARSITGPLIIRNTVSKVEIGGSAGTPDKRTKLELISTEKSSPCDEIEEEMAKQDDAISDLSNLLGQIKSMAIDMGSELGRQNNALDHLHDDADELNYRVKGANMRCRRLLGK